MLLARTGVVALLGTALLLGSLPSAVRADAAADQKAFEQSVSKAIEFLRTKGQAADGSYSAQAGPAVTALVCTGILRAGRGPDDPAVAKGLKYLEGFVQPDGGIYKEGTFHKNYETCLSMLAFAEANRDHRYDKLIAAADKFAKGNQWDGEDGNGKAGVNYGGAGYGKSKRPDLSNTQFLIEALRAAGNDAKSESIQKALVFVSRCQNLETEHNTTPFAAKNPDGGFYYTPAAGGSSQAGPTEQGGLRSYGSMTYAGLKSMIFAGVGPDDPRVKAAVKWLSQHYDLNENPGMGSAGLFYYYHTFAKALDALGSEEFADADGTKHAWRSELLQALVKRQKEDGSFINENARWMEGDANLVTGYALMTLPYCKPKK